MDLLNGKKTYLAAAGLMMTAVGGFLLSITGYESSMALDANQAITMFMAGFGLLGVGHKLEKSTDQARR